MRAHESPFTDSQVLSTNTDEVFKSVLSSGFLCRLKERGEIQEKIVSITVSTMSFNIICQGSKSLIIPQNNFLSRFKYISYDVKYFMQCFFFLLLLFKISWTIYKHNVVSLHLPSWCNDAWHHTTWDTWTGMNFGD